MLNRVRPLLLVAAVLLVGSMLLACKADKKKDSTGNQDNTPQATTSADTTPTAGGGGGDASSELSDLAAQFVSKPLKAAYTYSSSAGGQTSTVTVYTNPPDSWRLDIGSDGSTSILIKNADGSFICDDASSSCIASPVAAIPLPFFGFLNDPGAFADTIAGSFTGAGVDKSDVTIAGQDGKCYSVNSSITGAEATTEYCFTVDGLLLRAKVSAAGAEFSIEATSIDTSVDPADLQPPYPVTG